MAVSNSGTPRIISSTLKAYSIAKKWVNNVYKDNSISEEKLSLFGREIVGSKCSLYY